MTSSQPELFFRENLKFSQVYLLVLFIHILMNYEVISHMGNYMGNCILDFDVKGKSTYSNYCSYSGKQGGNANAFLESLFRCHRQILKALANLLYAFF